ncbi:hypothetical protein SDC9_204972 [bioreactor metagenome]|uniref:Uncharacterized protein n=1 Tax=bioreactor metagenome TaxID=1076179 RepID=A0A645J0R2_9ZZZZ
MHIDALVEQAPANAGHHGGTSPRTAGQGLAGTAFIDTQADFTAVEDLHEAGVHTLRKTGMVLDQRAVQLHQSGIHIVHQLHRMRIAHGNGCYPDCSWLQRRVECQRPFLC